MPTPNPVVAKTPDDAMVGSAIPAHNARAQDQFIVAGPNPYPTNIAQLVSQSTDDNERWFAQYGLTCGTPRLYKLMANDPAVYGSLSVLVDAVLAQGIKVLPRKQQHPREEPGTDPDAKLSQQVADEFDEAIRNLSEPIEVTAAEMMWGGFLERSKLAELVWGYPDAGPAVGKLCIASINPKPRDQWDYVCDSYGKVLGIVPSMPGPGGYYAFPPEKFAILAWNRRNGDPRGEVLIAPCYKPWELRVQLWPEYFKYLKRSAGQRLVGECQPDAQSNATGEDALLTPEERFAKQLSTFDNGTSIGIPNGAKVIPIEAKVGAMTFETAFSMLRKEIVSAILLAIRATEEAQHGSKADSQGAMDVLGNRLRFLKRWVTDWVEDIGYLQTLYNHGPQVAREHTPVVTLGDEDHQDIATLIAAFTAAGYDITESQKPGLDAKFGIDVREPGELAISNVPPVDPNAEPDGDEPPKGKKPADKGKDE